MRCEEIRELLERGEDPRGPGVERHLAECAACAELLADDARLGRWLVAADPQPEGRPPDLFAAVERSIQQDRGLRAWLRSRPTWWRYVVGAGAAALVVGSSLAKPRVDLALYPRARLLLELALLVALILFAGGRWLRPLHRPAASPAVSGVLVALAALAPALLALLPAAHTAHAMSVAGAGDDLLPRALACFAYGAVLGIPVALLGLGLGRAQRAGAAALLAVLAGALAGVAALQLHCPITHPAHLVLGHATIPAALGLCFGLGLRLRRRGPRSG